ncbi:MAG: hypothetical protein ABIA78_03510 [archaeon]
MFTYDLVTETIKFVIQKELGYKISWNKIDTFRGNPPPPEKRNLLTIILTDGERDSLFTIRVPTNPLGKIHNPLRVDNINPEKKELCTEYLEYFKQTHKINYKPF